MLEFLLTPPWLYVLIGVILIISILVYWKREAIKQKWDIELALGPLKLGRKADQERAGKADAPKSKPGVNFGTGNDFTGAKISRVAGRDIRHGESTAPISNKGETPGVDFGEKGTFKKAEIEDIAGRDLETKE